MRTISCLLAGLLLGGCADPQSSAAEVAESAAAAEGAEAAAAATATRRVIVRLNTEHGAVPDLIDALENKYPSAKTVRAMPAFQQVVFELPATEVPALKLEPEVQQLDDDGLNDSTR